MKLILPIVEAPKNPLDLSTLTQVTSQARGIITPMRKKVAVTLATGLLAGSISVGSAAPAQACSSRSVRSSMRSGALEVIGLRTFHLEVNPIKTRYKVGDTAKVEVMVTRPAHEDPVGLGQPVDPPESFPAEGVNIGMGLRVGDVFLFGHAMSDSDGRAIVNIKIKSYTPSGTATADAYAWKTAADTTCAKIEENGYRQTPKLFSVFRRI